MEQFKIKCQVLLVFHTQVLMFGRLQMFFKHSPLIPNRFEIAPGLLTKVHLGRWFL